MLQKLELGEASGILVTDINRLARNTSDGQRLLDMLDRKKLQIQTPAFAFDKSSLMLHLHMLLQRQEALSCSIKRGLQMRKWRRNLR